MEQSKKNDFKDHKLRWDLLPLKEIEDVVKVYTAGADKYGPNMWQNLPDGYNRYKGAMLRHLVEYEKGNEVDEETGCLHLAQMAWNAIAMLYCSKQKSKIDSDKLINLLDKRIEEKVDDCNKILDELCYSSINTITEEDIEIRDVPNNPSDRQLHYWEKTIRNAYRFYENTEVIVKIKKEFNLSTETTYTCDIENTNGTPLFFIQKTGYNEFSKALTEYINELKHKHENA